MKKIIILMAFAAMIAGCKHAENGQGGGGNYDQRGTLGTSTNTSDRDTSPSPSQTPEKPPQSP